MAAFGDIPLLLEHVKSETLSIMSAGVAGVALTRSALIPKSSRLGFAAHVVSSSSEAG